MEEQLIELAQRGFEPQLIFNDCDEWHVIVTLPDELRGITQGPVYHCESMDTPSQAVKTAYEAVIPAEQK